jgi:hypothetical protein
MYFESRELKPHAEPVTASELYDGEVYFSVTFVDDEMLIPVVDPVVLIGRNLEEGDVDSVYFQDADSFRRGIRYRVNGDGDATFYSGPETEINHIFEYEPALDVLLACAFRRRSRSG